MTATGPADARAGSLKVKLCQRRLNRRSKSVDYTLVQHVREAGLRWRWVIATPAPDGIPGQIRSRIAVWERQRPVYGDGFVNQIQRSVLWRMRGQVWILAACALTLVSGMAHKAHLAISPVAVLATVVLFAASFYCMWRMNRDRIGAYQSVSERLGIRIRVMNAPPCDERLFREWCSCHGVDPRLGGLDGGIADRDRPTFDLPSRLTRVDKTIWGFAGAFAVAFAILVIVRFV